LISLDMYFDIISLYTIVQYFRVMYFFK